MHGDKLVSKQKKRNYLTLSAHVNQFRENRHTKPVSQRTKRRLEHFNKKFREAEAKRPPAWGMYIICSLYYCDFILVRTELVVI